MIYTVCLLKQALYKSPVTLHKQNLQRKSARPHFKKNGCVSEVTKYLFFSVYDSIFRKQDWLYSLLQNFLITRCSFETRVLLTGTRSIWPAVRIDLAQQKLAAVTEWRKAAITLGSNPSNSNSWEHNQIPLTPDKKELTQCFFPALAKKDFIQLYRHCVVSTLQKYCRSKKWKPEKKYIERKKKKAALPP